jgi:hypothetical protein
VRSVGEEEGGTVTLCEPKERREKKVSRKWGGEGKRKRTHSPHLCHPLIRRLAHDVLMNVSLEALSDTMNAGDRLKFERRVKERFDEEDVASADEVETGALTACVLWKKMEAVSVTQKGRRGEGGKGTNEEESSDIRVLLETLDDRLLLALTVRAFETHVPAGENSV